MDIFRHLFSKPSKTIGGSTVQNYATTKKDPKLGFSNAPAEWKELRENHYRNWLGDSDSVFVWHEIVPIIPHVDILVFPPSKELDRNFFTLITSGMSDERMTLPKEIDKKFARAEIIFYVANDDSIIHQTNKPWYVEAMSFFAHFPFEYKTWLAPSHTLPNGNPPTPVVEGSSLTTALFLPAIFESQEFTQGFDQGNEKVNFLWLTYLNDKETEFKLNYGYDKLIDKMNTVNSPRVFNPFRLSII